MCIWQKQGRSKTQRFSRFQERDYMDPKQGLCLGALFDIAATNVRNPFFWYSCLLFSTNINCSNMPNTGTWFGKKTLHLWILPVCRDAQWCCRRHRLGTRWRGTFTFSLQLLVSQADGKRDRYSTSIIHWQWYRKTQDNTIFRKTCSLPKGNAPILTPILRNIITSLLLTLQ